jgi:hypothetical protein
MSHLENAARPLVNVDVRGAAHHLGLSKSHLDKLRMRRAGPPFSRLGRRIIYSIADLDHWVIANRVETQLTS